MNRHILKIPANSLLALTLIAQFALIFLSYFIPNNTFLFIYIICIPALGIANILYEYRTFFTLISPICICSFIWMILVPISSFPFPAMNAMSNFGIRIILFGGVCFFAAIIASNAIFKRFWNKESTIVFGKVDSYYPSISTKMMIFAAIVLCISCLSIIANFILNGSINLFIDGVSSSEKKTINAFRGYSLLSSIGSVASLVVCLCKKNRVFNYSLVFLYVILQLLTGQRWFVVLTFLLLLSSYSFVCFGKKEWAFLIGISIVVVVVFLFISYYRSNVSQFQKYYIETGKYDGSPYDLAHTELIRYFGMCQRNMEIVFSRSFDIDATFRYTLTALLFLFIKPESLSLNASINAYNANNTLSYLYSDFGPFWWIALIFLVFIVNSVFLFSRLYNRNLILRIFWSTCTVALFLSFFSYINGYFYWVLAFPSLFTIFAFVEKFISKKHERNN